MKSTFVYTLYEYMKQEQTVSLKMQRLMKVPLYALI